MTRLESIVAIARRKYFRKLPPLKIHWSDKLPYYALGATQGPIRKSDPKKFTIRINRDIRKMETIVIMTVLHELVHVEQWGNVRPERAHGRKFQYRMRELASKGAFDHLW